MASIAQDTINFVTADTSEVVAALDGSVSAGMDRVGSTSVRLSPRSSINGYRNRRWWIVVLGSGADRADGDVDPGLGRPAIKPVTIGVEHGAGPKALERLVDAGLALPPGWRKVQDHGKRGIVVEVPAGTEAAAIVDWLVSACWSLCAIDIDDHWNAVVNVPESSPGP